MIARRRRPPLVLALLVGTAGAVLAGCAHHATHRYATR